MTKYAKARGHSTTMGVWKPHPLGPTTRSALPCRAILCGVCFLRIILSTKYLVQNLLSFQSPTVFTHRALYPTASTVMCHMSWQNEGRGITLQCMMVFFQTVRSTLEKNNHPWDRDACGADSVCRNTPLLSHKIHDNSKTMTITLLCYATHSTPRHGARFVNEAKRPQDKLENQGGGVHHFPEYGKKYGATLS